MNSISNNIESMGMRIKPSKCRTFSIKSGSPSVVDFNFNGVHIPSIFAEEQKYLGKVISYSGKSSDTFELVKEIFREKLENIDQTMVRNEYKLWIYQNYFLNSHRFLLTIHDITQTDLKVLDRFTDKYLKKWAGVPQCTTNALFHLRTGLDIKSISQLYEVCHCMSHARTRLRGDDQVNHVLTSKSTGSLHK
jgi:hypothetical protein